MLGFSLFRVFLQISHVPGTVSAAPPPLDLALGIFLGTFWIRVATLIEFDAIWIEIRQFSIRVATLIHFVAVVNPFTVFLQLGLGPQSFSVLFKTKFFNFSIGVATLIEFVLWDRSGKDRAPMIAWTRQVVQTLVVFHIFWT